MSGLRLPHWKLTSVARYDSVHPKRLATQAIIGTVLMTSCAVGLHTSWIYLTLPVGIGGALLFLHRPLLGLLLTLVGGMSLPWTGAGGVNFTILGLLFLITIWLLHMLITQSNLHFSVAAVTRPALLLLIIVALALVIGQMAWYRTQAAPLSAQFGGLTVFITALGTLLFVGHQLNETRGLAILTWVVIGYGALHMIGWVEPHLGRYIRLLYQDGATTSMFWTWVVTLAFSQALFNWRLGRGWRLALFGVVVLTFYVAYGLNGDWKSGWMPALLSAAILVLFRFWHLRYLLAPLSLLPAANLVSKARVSDDYSYATRLEAWAIIGEIVKVNPLLGLGPANYYWYTPLFRIRGYTVNFNSHNQYVDLLAQSGMLGLCVYLWLLGALGWLGWRLRHRVDTGFEQAYVYGALAGWVATVAAGALGDWVLPFVYNVGLSGVRSSILPWVFLGGLLALARKYPVTQA